MRITSFIAFSTLGLALVACRGSSNNNTPDSPGGGDGPSGAVKIQDVQNDQMAPGTPVSLSGVIVTAIDSFGAKTGDIWVEEPEGGAFSGIHIFGVPATAVGQLQIGDIVDVSGAVKDEFALTADTTGRTETELKAAMGGMITVTKTGTGTVPAPQVVDALMIGQMSDADTAGPMFSAEWEKWEGVLITVNNVSATSGVKSFGSTSPTPADNYSFGITGVAKVEGSLTDITMSSIARTTCFSDMTGVLDYFFDYLVLPRSSADFATGGTNCPQAESACADTIDNDGNGFTDCADNGCIINDNACRATTTIAALDQAADAMPASPTLPAGGLQITGACVTAVATGTNPSNMYIAAAGVAANDGGLFVFGGGQPLPAGVVAGSTVDIIGTATGFKSTGSTATNVQLEFNSLQVTKNNPNCNPNAKAVTSPMSTLTQDANGHPLIGSLVTLTPTGGTFKITTAQTATGKFGVLTQGTTTVSFGMTLLAGNLGALNTCFATITGIWTYDTNGAGSYEILPTATPTAVTCI